MDHLEIDEECFYALHLKKIFLNVKKFQVLLEYQNILSMCMYVHLQSSDYNSVYIFLGVITMELSGT